MKKLSIYIALIAAFVFSQSCKKDFLNTKLLTEFPEGDTWKDPALIEAFVNGIYLSIANPADDVNGRLRGEFVDEMHDQWYSFFEFNNSLLTADDLASWPHEE